MSAAATAGARRLAPASPREMAEALAQASRDGAQVRIEGQGSRPRPLAARARPDLVLGTGALRAIVAHEPGDQTLTVQAGMPLAELDAHLARHGQFLPAALRRTAGDPAGRGSVGGWLATAEDAPEDLGDGAVRDQVLGCTVALCDGTLARGRGRVVKNVAGYDLPRLLTGSLGTLGVLVEVSLKLQPRPACRVLLRALGEDADAAFAAARGLLDSGLEPASLDLLCSEASRQVELLVGLHGEPGAVEQRARLAAQSLGAARVERLAPAEAAARLDALQAPQGGLVGQLVVLPSRQAQAAAALLEQARVAGLPLRLDARPGTGRMLFALDAEPPVAPARALLAAARRFGPTVLLRAPDALATCDDVWGPPPSDLFLMRRVKQALDPRGTLAPGTIAGGL